MNLNIQQMIAGPPSRLRYVFRYSTSRVSHPESVAEHSYYVALYSMLIGRWFTENNFKESDDPNEDPTPVDMENLLQRALLHDLEEAVSGDFPRPFKRSSPELQEILQRASKKAFEQVIEPVIGKQTTDFIEEEDGTIRHDTAGNVTDEYICSWLDAKDGTLEGRILEFADFLAVLSFLMQEGAANGNTSINDHISNMEDYFRIFTTVSFMFIRPLVDQAQVLMEQLFPKKPLQVRT